MFYRTQKDCLSQGILELQILEHFSFEFTCRLYQFSVLEWRFNAFVSVFYNLSLLYFQHYHMFKMSSLTSFLLYCAFLLSVARCIWATRRKLCSVASSGCILATCSWRAFGLVTRFWQISHWWGLSSRWYLMWYLRSPSRENRFPHSGQMCSVRHSRWCLRSCCWRVNLAVNRNSHWKHLCRCSPGWTLL